MLGRIERHVREYADENKRCGWNTDVQCRGALWCHIHSQWGTKLRQRLFHFSSIYFRHFPHRNNFQVIKCNCFHLYWNAIFNCLWKRNRKCNREVVMLCVFSENRPKCHSCFFLTHFYVASIKYLFIKSFDFFFSGLSNHAALLLRTLG